MAIHFPSVPATYRNIPKTGTTSFKFWAMGNVVDCEIAEDPERPGFMQHLSLEQLHAKWQVGTTFTFVRNPYARMVSIFHHVGQDAEARMADRVQRKQTAQVNLIPIESDLRIMKLYRRGFDEWVHTVTTDIASCPLVRIMTQRYPQMHYLNGVKPDIVIKIENVNQEFHKIQTLLACDAPPLHVNTSKHTDYRDYYNATTKSIVREIYKDDFEAFDYDY